MTSHNSGLAGQIWGIAAAVIKRCLIYKLARQYIISCRRGASLPPWAICAASSSCSSSCSSSRSSALGLTPNYPQPTGTEPLVLLRCRSLPGRIPRPLSLTVLHQYMYTTYLKHYSPPTPPSSRSLKNPVSVAHSLTVTVTLFEVTSVMKIWSTSGLLATGGRQ